jgi:hypothetical protein
MLKISAFYLEKQKSFIPGRFSVQLIQIWGMLYPPGIYFVKKPKRFVILSSDKSSERNLSNFFDIKKPRRIEHLQSEEPFSSDPYFSMDNFGIL